MDRKTFPSLAVATVLLALVVVFFPSLFFGRVISPLDVLYKHPPWRAVHHPVEVTNPDLEAPATAYLPLMEAARQEGTSIAVWNPYLAGGGAGLLTWSNGLLSPTVLPFLPWLDPAFFPNALVLGKLLLAFIGAWLLGRRLGLGTAGASACGAAFALSGPLTATWLWPSSASAAALPLLLWAVDRTLGSERPWRTAGVGATAWLVFLAGGAPGSTMVGLYVVAGWTAWRLRASSDPPGRIAKRLPAVGVGALLAGAVLAPAMGLFTVTLGPSGALGSSLVHRGWGWSALRLLVDPFAFGDPRRGTFVPPAQLGGVAFHHLVLNIGFVTAVLALIGLVSRRKSVGFWAGTAAVFLAALAWTPAASAFSLLPGLRWVPVYRGAPVIALAAAMLAGFGVTALAAIRVGPGLRRAVPLLVAAIVLEQGLFAGHLLAFLPPREARWTATRGLDVLRERAAGSPTRIAPLGDSLPPDTAQAYGLEDVRAEYSSTSAFRRLLTTVDPQATTGPGRLLRLNPATTDLNHPYLRALGARWVVEDPRYGLVDFLLGQNTLEVEPRQAMLGPLRKGDVVEQDLRLPAGCSRLAVNGAGRGVVGGALRTALTDEIDGRKVADWTIPAASLARDGSVWLNLPPGLRPGRRFRLRIEATNLGGRVWLRRTADPAALDGALRWRARRVKGDLGLSFDVSGYVPVYSGADLRIWENRHALPRFWVVRRIVAGDLQTMASARPPFDLGTTALIPPQEAAVLRKTVHSIKRPVAEELRLTSWGPAEYSLRSRLAAPALLVSSLPIQPRLWRAAIDGRRRPLQVVNGLFAGLRLPAGDHRLELRARVPWTWWALSCLGFVGLAGALEVERRGRKEVPL